MVGTQKGTHILACVPAPLLILEKWIDNPPAFQKTERKSGTCVPGAQSSQRLAVSHLWQNLDSNAGHIERVFRYCSLL